MSQQITRGRPAAARSQKMEQLHSSQPPSAVCSFLASHVSTPERLLTIRQCIRSIRSQVCLPSKLLISWSSTDANLAARMKHLLEVETRGLPCECFEQENCTSQFGHYTFLASQVGGQADSTWILFSDDVQPCTRSPQTPKVHQCPQTLFSPFSPTFVCARA